MSPDDEAESTFADVFNGLMGGGPASRRAGRQAREPARPAEVPLFEEAPQEENAASVRAYAWTGGRARPSAQLEIETLVSTTGRAEELMHTMRSEHQSVARLCRQTRSVAEIGALLSLPLGVVRVLLDDMAGLGLVTVHTTRPTGDGQPDLDLLRRVLRGLSNLRT
ncbi:DUF742 domain-containing protein [Actinophytocola sp.]|uniref:DUF742 domain-containing protein n=1 Tax=Actinophytocola sp. TaxID=1872138 RepID=UPI00389ABF66